MGGVRVPFQEFDYYETFEAETSNVANQVALSIPVFSTLFVIMRRFDKTLSFIRNEKSQSLFILLCLASALWSDYPELSIKRSFQLFVMFIVVVEALVNIDPRILLRQLLINRINLPIF
ncbi:MAG: hypothetical protein MZV64_69465 [Ignavibacteriales bacterium]|nr:hypothetical protein [Ignavibacteriales bacterium]